MRYPGEELMTQQRGIKLTRFEIEIMDALWDLGSASIREIHEELPERKRPAYTTVQTIIRRLEEKGAVRQSKQIGNAHIFEPLMTREAAHRRLIDDLLELFGGSARPLMAHLAEAGKLTLEDVKELENLLMERERSPEPDSAERNASPARPSRQD
jgi:BlaI family transcriptional regulator, penicillinase repressor